MLSLYAPIAAALEIVPFSTEALAQAQRADAPIALHFHSKSCGTCRLQAKAFEAMRADTGPALTLLVVDFDEDRETPRAFRVMAPGALIALRGSVERARLLGVVEPERLRAALRSAL
ncbi:MAG: thioredoxin family protein [Burkholderiaceae bacterium]|nr:thioredoxin family protein [Burkholderiaceae bacterium]